MIMNGQVKQEQQADFALVAQYSHLNRYRRGKSSDEEPELWWELGVKLVVQHFQLHPSRSLRLP